MKPPVKTKLEKLEALEKASIDLVRSMYTLFHSASVKEKVNGYVTIVLTEGEYSEILRDRQALMALIWNKG